ncbi:hypothetical protein CD110_04720 [Staphylococcus casei]|uniref:hypothetical protein n=1 Tax=Staphylococcus TaxID=1279 RepID=UPI000CD28783|nr:hypothetical protein [Staphylococcus casei]PNZ60528.1 hypothetical protein CD110_04720 [Staphylococcus casei]WJE85739.1 hypothetical protein QMO72_09980 [Staphylococcus casei]
MVKLVAICEVCDKVFQSSFELKDSYKIFMKNNKETCPYCGGLAFIPDGVYNVKDEIINIFSIDDGKDLYKLEKVLNSVKKGDSIKNVENKINSETPQYHGIMDVIRKFCDKNKSVFAAAGVVSQILFSSYSIYAENHEDTLHNEVQQKNENIKQQQYIIDEQKEIIKYKSE